MDISWKLRRIAYLAKRVAGSIAIRGWRGTWRRLMQESAAFSGSSSAQVNVRLPAAGHSVRRLLVIDGVPPDPSRDSGSMRLCHIFALLNEDGWSIDFISDAGKANTADSERLGNLGVRIGHDAHQWLVAHGSTLDAVMLCRLPIASYYLSLVRRYAPAARVIFDTVDLHFIREQRAADLSGSPAMMRQAKASRKRELAMVNQCDVTLVVSDIEREILCSTAPSARIEVVSNIHQVQGRARPFEGRKGILFVGGFGHPPNEDAVLWFVRDILPLIRQTDPNLIFHVVGDIDPRARRLIERPGVEVHGRVAELAPLFADVLISVAPLRFGAGVKGKVNQAMSFGVPVVLTGVAAEGMHLTDGDDCLIADSAKAFANAILRLSQDPLLWSRLSDGGLDNVRRHFSIERARGGLRRALETM